MSRASTIVVSTPAASATLDLDDLVPAGSPSAPSREPTPWIKRLRHARVDGAPLRDRFTLPRRLAVVVRRAVPAQAPRRHARLAQLARARSSWPTERPARVGGSTGDAVVGHVAHAGRRAPRIRLCRAARTRGRERAGGDARPRRSFTRATALADRLRPTAAGAGRSSARSPPSCTAPSGATARRTRRLHRARSSTRAARAASATTRIAAGRRRPADELPGAAVVAIALGSSPTLRRAACRHAGRRRIARLAGSRAVAGAVATRAAMSRARCARSADLRAAAIVDGCDLLGAACAGAATASPLCSSRGRRARWTKPAPRSTRSRRDVVAHLRRSRRLGPRARARSAPPRHPLASALQHGFIYRHWLNYLTSPTRCCRRRRTRPIAASRCPTGRWSSTTTRASISRQRGRFPPAALASPAARGSTRSPRASRGLTAGRGGDSRASSARRRDEPIVVVAAKYAQIARGRSAALVDARARALPRCAAGRQAASGRDAPTPTRDAIARRRQRRASRRRTAASAALLAVASRRRDRQLHGRDRRRCRSGVPALVVGLPNNLSPFVDAGVHGGRRDRRPRSSRRCGRCCMIGEMRGPAGRGARRRSSRRYGIRRRRRQAARRARRRQFVEL